MNGANWSRGLALAFTAFLLTWTASACSDDPTEPTITTFTVRDTDHVQGKYFFVVDPDSSPAYILDDIRVYLDDATYANDVELGARPAQAWLDPDLRTPEDPYLGYFHLLQEGIDYSISTFVALPQGSRVVTLLVPLTRSQVLAVAYAVEIDGQRIEVGDISPAPEDTVINLKILRPSVELWGTTDLTQSVWAPANRLEIKSVYNLGSHDIDPTTLDLRIRWNLAGTEEDPFSLKNEFGVVTALTEVFGLDQRNNVSTTDLVPDGHVDPEYIDYEAGIVIFPDLRPFDPSLSDIQGTVYRDRSWPAAATATRPDTLGWYLGAGGIPVESPPSVRAVEVVPALYDLRSDELSRRRSEVSLYYLEATVRR